MTKVLKVWGCHWQSAILYEKPFKVKTSWFKKVTAFSGFAYKHKGQWLVVFKDAQQLVFQCKQGRWLIGQSECQISYFEDGSRQFQLSLAQGESFYAKYKLKRLFLDPTYDSFDEEFEDFFGWLHRIWNDPDWASGLVKKFL